MSTSVSSSENSTPATTDSQAPSTPAAPPPTATQQIQQPAAARAKRQNAVWTSADDATLVAHLKEARTEGGQADNGWKSWVWNGAATLLAGGKGGPKTWKGCRDHWRNLVGDYNTVCWLRVEASGFGWDRETKSVTATKEVWDIAIRARKGAAKFCGKSFPLYDDIADLVEGKQATGKGAHRVPAQTPPGPANPPPTPTPAGAALEGSTRPRSQSPQPDLDIGPGETDRRPPSRSRSATPDNDWIPSHPTSPRTPQRGRKRDATEEDSATFSSQKRPRARSPTSPLTSSSATQARLTGPIAVNNVADAVARVASSLSTSTTAIATPTRRTKAVKMVADDDSLTEDVQISAITLFTKDIAACDSYLAIPNHTLRNNFLCSLISVESEGDL